MPLIFVQLLFNFRAIPGRRICRAYAGPGWTCGLGWPFGHYPFVVAVLQRTLRSAFRLPFTMGDKGTQIVIVDSQTEIMGQRHLRTIWALCAGVGQTADRGPGDASSPAEHGPDRGRLGSSGGRRERTTWYSVP